MIRQPDVLTPVADAFPSPDHLPALRAAGGIAVVEATIPGPREEYFDTTSVAANLLAAEALITNPALNHVELSLPLDGETALDVWEGLVEALSQPAPQIGYDHWGKPAADRGVESPDEIVCGAYRAPGAQLVSPIQVTLVRRAAVAVENSETASVTLYRGVPREFQAILCRQQ